jgi:RNA polymerase sigma-70 factor (ECF subfamily)
LITSHRSVEGDFNAAYERLQPSLWRYVHRLVGDGDVTDDVVQEAFVRLLARPDLHGDSARLWLFTVATNLVRDRGRTAVRRKRLLTAIPVQTEPTPQASDRVERAERVQSVRDALDDLPERDRHLLLMREEGFSYQEIAAAIGVAPGSVGTLIARAIKRFTAVYRPLEE